MADTLADLMREVGLGPPAYLDAAYRQRPYARAQPRVMRSPTERANDPMLAPSERRRAYNQAQAALTPPPDAELGGATGVSPNQVADAGRQLWELTPVPPAQRLRQAIDQGNPSEAVQSAGTLALNTAGLFGFMLRGARAPVREPLPARMPPRPSGAPDAGGGMRSTSDFDIGPLYRGHDGDPSTGHWRASEGMNGEGVYLTHDEAQANNWALRQAETDPTVHAVRVRGPIADSGPGGITFEEARAQGYRGLRYRDDHGYDETVIFDPRDVSPSLSRRAARSAPTTARVGGPPQAPSDATRGGAESAYLAQLRADGFDVDTPLYHGSTAQTPIENLRPSSDGLLGPGVYVTDSPSVASEFAVHDVGGGAGQVMPVYARGPFASTSEWRMIAETEGPQEAIRLLREQGYRGVRGRWGRDGSTQTVVFDPSDLRSRFGSPRPTPSDATRGGPPGPPDSKSYRSRKPPSGGFLLPRRKT